MKTKLLLGLALLATVGLTSCKKDKDKLEDNNEVKIGDKTYSTVAIGSQVWMTENYSGNDGVYYQVDGTNKTEYGKYYTLAEAKAITPPAGWRLPTKDDVKKLMQVYTTNIQANGPSSELTRDQEGIKKLLSATGWAGFAGTNASGLSFLPAGYKNDDGFAGQTILSIFWTSSTYTPSSSTANYPIYFLIQQNSSTEAVFGYGNNNSSMDTYKMSVRFVKDK